MTAVMSAIGMGQWMTIVIMAIALGMDAFSLGIGIGLRRIRWIDMVRISAVVGLFHMVMPLVGVYMGNYVGGLLGGLATLIGGALLVLLGGHMILNSFRGEQQVPPFDYRRWGGLLLFAGSVSVDSLSVGVSLGLFATHLVATVLLFGLFGSLLSICGLLVGHRAGSWVGEYGEAIGGVILLAFGLRFLI